MIQLDRTVITREMIDAAADSLANEPTLFGESVAKFEEEFARYCGTDHAVSVASGTDALVFCLIAAGVEGKEVLTTPSSYIATANAALHAGAEPAFCDIEAKTSNINPEKVEMMLSSGKRIKAVIPVHLHGYPAGMDGIMEAAEKKGVFVLEDACQAHGAMIGGRRAGAVGHAGAFSFNPVKNMTVGGSAGMVTTNDDKIAKTVRMLGDSGRDNPYTHEHAIVGYTSRINTVNAAIGRVQLRHLEGWNEERRGIARTYRRLLSGVGGITLPAEPPSGVVPVYNKFAIRSRERDRIRGHLYENGIESDSHYPIPIHLQPPYRKMGYKKGDYPEAERFADTTLSLPVYVGMSEDETRLVAEKVTEYFERKG
jgi:perosamine synthetase